MDEPRLSLLLGTMLSFIYVVINSQITLLLRIALLPPQVCLTFLLVGIFISTLPFFGIACRNWMIRSKNEWLSFLTAGTLFSLNLIAWQLGAQHLPSGDFAAIDAAGILVAPLLFALLRRHCVDPLDAAGVIVAAAGLLLIAKPSFLPLQFLGSSDRDPPLIVSTWRGYLGAAFSGLTTMLMPFILGNVSHVHWSNFICLQVPCVSVVLIIFVAVAGWPSPTTAPPSMNPASSSSSDSASLFLSSSSSLSSTLPPYISSLPPLPILSATLTGVLTTLFRLSLVLACADLESCGVGMAGFICNVVNAGLIPVIGDLR